MECIKNGVLFLQLAAEKKDKKIQMRHHNIFAVLCICFGTSASKDSKYLVRVRIYQLISYHPFQVQKCGSIQGCTVELCSSFDFDFDFDFDFHGSYETGTKIYKTQLNS